MGDCSSMFTDSVECLTNGAPHAAQANALLSFFAQLPGDTDCALARTLTTLYLTHHAEELRLRAHFKIVDYQHALGATLQFAQHLVSLQQLAHKRGTRGTIALPSQFEEVTQSHYGNLFQSFSEYHYYEEPVELLRTRWRRNEIAIANMPEKKALDAGCGGGRYTLALKALGFGEVVGIDFSPLNLETARSRAQARNIAGVTYQTADVLKLPFADDAFDFAFSNGVLHHTQSIEQGIRELHRVLKPGGLGWLFIIGKPGGIEWDTVEILRQIMRPVPHEFARQTLLLAGIPQNRIFYILDHIMVPINTMSTIQELELLLRQVGFVEMRRLNRGTDFDATELIFQRATLEQSDPEFVWKYGIGELRYLFSKAS